jgi:regulator of replication initiation timing
MKMGPNLTEIRRKPVLTLDSFSTKLKVLREENARLNKELNKWRDRAATESNFKRHAEKEANQLRVTNQQLQKEACNNIITTDYFRRSVLKYAHVLNTVLPLLEESKTEMYLGDSESPGDMILFH